MSANNAVRQEATFQTRKRGATSNYMPTQDGFVHSLLGGEREPAGQVPTPPAFDGSNGSIRSHYQRREGSITAAHRPDLRL